MECEDKIYTNKEDIYLVMCHVEHYDKDDKQIYCKDESRCAFKTREHAEKALRAYDFELATDVKFEQDKYLGLTMTVKHDNSNLIEKNLDIPKYIIQHYWINKTALYSE